MAVTCSACGHWSLNGEHSCPAVWAKHNPPHKTMTPAELWQRALLEAMHNGRGPVLGAGDADLALRNFTERFHWDSDVSGWVTTQRESA